MKKFILGVFMALLLTIVPTTGAFAAPVDVDTQLDIDNIDIIIVGGSPAGYSAAIESAILGQKTIVLDDRDIEWSGYFAAPRRALQISEPKQSEEELAKFYNLAGGESTGGLHTQLKNKLDEQLRLYQATSRQNTYFDSTEAMTLDIYNKGEYTGNLEFIDKIFSRSIDTSYWLEQQGIIWDDQLHSIDGDLRGLQPINYGGDILAGLKARAMELGVQVVEDLTVEDLYRDHEKITKIVTTKPDGDRVDIEFEKGIILATGNYVIDKKDIKIYKDKFHNEFVEGIIGSDGLALRLAKDVGADLLGMDSLEEIKDPETKEILAYRVSGGIKTDDNYQMIDTYGDEIPSVYATGDLIYGLWGEDNSDEYRLTSQVILGRMTVHSIVYKNQDKDGKDL